jgi:hypothetical protein
VARAEKQREILLAKWKSRGEPTPILAEVALPEKPLALAQQTNAVGGAE